MRAPRCDDFRFISCKQNTWARAEIFPEGQNHQHFKKLTGFRRAVQKIDHCSICSARQRHYEKFCVLQRFRVKCRVNYMAHAKILGYFGGRQHNYDLIFFKFQGRASAPLPPPLRAPMTTHETSPFSVPSTLSVPSGRPHINVHELT